MEGLFTYDQDINIYDFTNKYSLRDTTLAPFHAFVRMNTPYGVKNTFFANMTCSESQVTDPYFGNTFMSTTWSFDSSVEAMITDVMVNRTKAFTGGRDGHDSKCGFY